MVWHPFLCSCCREGPILTPWWVYLTITFAFHCFCYYVSVLLCELCPTLCNPMDCSPPASSIHVILLARILEWVAIPFSRWSSWLRDQTLVSCIAGRVSTIWGTGKPTFVIIITYDDLPQEALPLYLKRLTLRQVVQGLLRKRWTFLLMLSLTLVQQCILPKNWPFFRSKWIHSTKLTHGNAFLRLYVKDYNCNKSVT